MKQYAVTFLPAGITVSVEAGTTLLQAERLAGLSPNAPCGEKGTCGKIQSHNTGRGNRPGLSDYTGVYGLHPAG